MVGESDTANPSQNGRSVTKCFFQETTGSRG